MEFLVCGICKDVFASHNVQKENGLIAPISCGHVFHSQCFSKFEQEGNIILKVCFICKKDYANVGVVNLNPVMQPAPPTNKSGQQQSSSPTTTTTGGVKGTKARGKGKKK